MREIKFKAYCDIGKENKIFKTAFILIISAIIIGINHLIN